MQTKFYSGNLKGLVRPLHRYRREDNITMNLKEIRCGLPSSGSRWGPEAGSRECGNETSDSIKGREFLDKLTDY
jgi:hypothetical protein